ncbi:MAG: hypothetical protein VB093_03205, partial [Propionicimonas sp.]|nr:hypothetical protein [Propionicimonas sp.]
RGVITVNSMQEIAETESQHSTTCRREVDELRLAINKVTSGPNIIDIIPKLSSLVTLGDEAIAYVLGTWRHLSGMQHGQLHAVVAASDLRDSQEIRGGFQSIVSARDGWFYNTCVISSLLQKLAMSAFIQRTETIHVGTGQHMGDQT